VIEKNFYDEKVRETIELMGVKTLTKKTTDIIYQKIQYNYDHSDLIKALDELIETTDKFTYHTLIKLLNKYSAIRREEENTIRKAKEEEDAKRFWRENYTHIKQGICNRKCLSCKVIYCDIIKAESSKGVRDILTGKRTVEEVNQEMASKFEGWNAEFLQEPF
jgi:hypothetical protein